MAAMRLQLQDPEQLGELRISDIGCRKPHILLDRAPWQQPRLLENHADPGFRWARDASLEIAVEPEDNAQHRALAAARGTDQDADLARPKREADRREHLLRSARGTPEALACDIDLKPHGVATVLRGLRTVAPARSRSRGRRRRRSANTPAAAACRTAGKQRRSRSRRRSAAPGVRRPARSSTPATIRSGLRLRYRARVAAARRGGTRASAASRTRSPSRRASGRARARPRAG